MLRHQYMRFVGSPEFGKSIPKFSDAEIKNEPMFFNASLDFAYTNGGPITGAFIDQLPLRVAMDLVAVFDSRSHMLMPGMYPCIPGWHHDDVPRNTPNGQPDYDIMAYRSQHIMALVNGDVAPTEFLRGQIDVPRPGPGQVTYKEWDEYIEAYRPEIKNSSCEFIQAPSSRLIHFDWQTFHRGTAAIKTGWRWFGRVSWNTDRRATDEIRKQVQVYMPTINSGW